MADKTKIVMALLIFAVIVLAGIVVYAFVVQPSISGYAVERQSEGYVFAVNSILTQIQQNGFAQITVGNQTIYLAPFDPTQIEQTQATAQ